MHGRVDAIFRASMPWKIVLNNIRQPVASPIAGACSHEMKSKASLLVLSVAALSASAALGQISVYVSPNDIQSAEASGIQGVNQEQIFTETFNNYPMRESDQGAPLNTWVNGYVSPTTGITYSSSNGDNVQPNDQYGGYNEGYYLGVNPTNSTVLTLADTAKYFGFYFTAGDVYNSIDIYSGDSLLLSFSTASLIQMLPNTEGSTITAINGSKYNTIDYYGQPVSGLNSYEPYAYLHFVAEGNLTFDKIVLNQGANAIFESDNHSILTGTPIIPDSLVKVPTTVPEGGPGLLALSLMAGSLTFLRKKRAR